MGIYQVCKTVITRTAITRTALISAALLAASITTSCSQPQVGTAASEATGGQVPVSSSAQNQPDAASEQASASEPAAPVNKGVKTTHDIYHAKTIEVPAGKPVPAITVRMDEDKVSGWNLYVGTANFTFTPRQVGGESSYTGGHANLYVNDEPASRIYSTWTHIPTLPPGTNEIRVTLNANSYETLTTQDTPIEDSVTVEVYDPNAE